LKNLKQYIDKPLYSLIAKEAGGMGIEAYVIGGYVRDVFLERDNCDIDIVCLGDGITLAKRVAKQLDPKLKVSIFKNFGTAHFKWKKQDVEFVGARKESYNKSSRKPIVTDGTLEDDQNRRDFTINAMGIALNHGEQGKLLDPFNGLKDLKDKIIRTPLDPDITFSDDPLRMIRAIRFASQLGFKIEPTTYEGLKRNVERINIVSQERISDELQKIIASDTPSYGFKLLYDVGLLNIIFPEFSNLQGVDIVGKFTHKDNFYHTLQVLDNVAKVSDNIWLRWSAIMHDIGKASTKRMSENGWTFHSHEVVGSKMVKTIFKRMRLPLDNKMKYVRKLVYLHLRPIALAQDSVTDSGIRRLLFEAGEELDDLLILCRADITSKNEKRVKKYLNNFQKVEDRCKEVEKLDKLRYWQPPISGELIMDTFDIKPSKEVGDIKIGIREAILEGDISNNYEDAYAYMLKLGKNKGLKSKTD
jgi:putative nucleotidyltransferase with HDIG domain